MDCHKELVRAKCMLGQLAPNVGACWLPTAGVAGLIGRDNYDLKGVLFQGLPATDSKSRMTEGVSRLPLHVLLSGSIEVRWYLLNE